MFGSQRKSIKRPTKLEKKKQTKKKQAGREKKNKIQVINPVHMPEMKFLIINNFPQMVTEIYFPYAYCQAYEF